MAEYRIDELARMAGTTVRNIRVYQDRGLLPPPRRAGRVGIYSDAHLARLRLIGQLLERGYTFAHIAEMVAAWEQGRDLGQLLGLEAAISGPWSDEIPGYVTAAELERMFGGEATPERVARAVEIGIVEPEGDRFRVPSPRLLHAGAELVAAGMPLEEVLDLAAELRRDMEGVARRFVERVGTRLVDPEGLGSTPTEDEIPGIAALVLRLRPLAQMSVDAELARAMEREVRARFGERVEAVLGEASRKTGTGAS